MNNFNLNKLKLQTMESAKKSKCKICLIKKSNSECSIKTTNTNNNNNNNNNYFNQRYQHKCLHNNNNKPNGSNIISIENQELISLNPYKKHDYLHNTNDLLEEELNNFAIRILFLLMFHFSSIIITISFFCYLEESNSVYAINSILTKLNDKISKYLFIFIYFLIVFFFILMICVSKISLRFPFNLLVFLFYTFIISLFYSYLTQHHANGLFIQFFFIILLDLFLLLLFCFCQRKLTLINKPIVPYIYSYLCLIIFLFIFYLVKAYFKSITYLVYSNETLFEFLAIIFISFLYIFYIIFDLQFILSNYYNNNNNNEDQNNISSITSAFNLITKDIVQLIFLFNSYILNSIK
jgi:hypothetical protein